MYELTSKSSAALSRGGTDLTKWKGDRNFWHQLMVADMVLSLEIACKKRNLHFRHRTEIIGDMPLQFKCSITHQFSKHTEHYDGALQPDELFAIDSTYFVLEADRQHEPISRPTLKTSSYLRKVLQYRDVLKSGSYKALVPYMIVLNITTSPDHARNIRDFMYNELSCNPPPCASTVTRRSAPAKPTRTPSCTYCMSRWSERVSRPS